MVKYYVVDIKKYINATAKQRKEKNNMFGANYSYQKQPKILADGDYQITLNKPFETMVGSYKVLRFPFSVNGEKELCTPNYFDLFDVMNPDDVTKITMFNKQASKIKACFKLQGDFNEHNYTSWFNKTGKVRIEKSKSGFANVVTFYKADMTIQEESML